MKTILIILITITIFSSTQTVFGQSSEKIKIEHIAGSYTIAEGPHWDEERNLLYFVDIPYQKIFCYNPATQNITYAYLDCGPVGFAIPLSGRNNTFIAGCKTSIIIVYWDPSTNNPNPEYHVISQVDQDISDTRFNDAKVDPRGRLWAGTMGIKNGVPLTDKGSVYRVDHDGTVAKIIDRVDISNGLVWNHFNDSFYFIDSFSYKIDEYSYNVNFGEIANKCTMFDLKKNNLTGIPDGMTIDKAGNLWVANHGGGLILKIDPKTGRLLQSIKMPVTLVTSVAFGGPNKNILYVTTAKDKLNATQLAKEPLAGSVFALHNLCVSGSPMRSCVMNF